MQTSTIEERLILVDFIVTELTPKISSKVTHHEEKNFHIMYLNLFEFAAGKSNIFRAARIQDGEVFKQPRPSQQTAFMVENDEFFSSSEKPHHGSQAPLKKMHMNVHLLF